MFKAEGVALDRLNLIPKDIGAMEKLMAGDILGMNGSVANQPFALRQAGVQVRLIRPDAYGIDYFGDSLITTEHERENHADRVAAMTRAVLRGWAYAMNHPEEMVDHILDHYQLNKSREQLLFEADALRGLILPDLIDIGHISHERLARTFASYQELGLVPVQSDIDGLVHDPLHSHRDFGRSLLLVGLVLLVVLVVAGFLMLFNRQLRRKVLFHTSELEKSNTALMHEMNQRIQAQSKAAERESQLRNLIESTHAVAFESDLESGMFTYLGPQTMELFGYSPTHWKTFDDWFAGVHPDDQEDAKEFCLRQTELGLDHDLEYRIVCADGSSVWVHDVVTVVLENEKPVRSMGVMIDVTRLKEAEHSKSRIEKSLRHSQKMEAVGLLAGGIAHDLNNLLLPILGHTEMMAEDLAPESSQRESLSVVQSAAERAQSLVRQLLAFGRKQVLEVRPINLSEVVVGFEPLLQRTITENISIKTELDEVVLSVRADIGQIEQVVMNLAINAQDAMPDGGQMTIGVHQVELDEDFPSKWQDARPGKYVVLVISDTGLGMDEATQARVFEPFYTTKGDVGGTGMGLASVHGIVKQHGGHIDLYSEVGEGASFRIYFPALAPEEVGAVSAPFQPKAASTGEIPRGAESILLVEDDVHVRRYLEAVLTRLGYRVHLATDGQEAVEVFDGLKDELDLVLTDVIMPQMSGREVYEHVRVLRPGIAFLFMSGYSDNMITEQGLLDEGLFFVQKPFTREILAVKLREALAAGNAQH